MGTLPSNKGADLPEVFSAENISGWARKSSEKIDTIQYFQYEAQVALGLKILKTKPRTLDPQSFVAADVARRSVLEASMSSGFGRRGKEQAEELEAFMKSASSYLDSVSVSPQVGRGLG